ncbi:hypothetical protein SAMN04488095_1995 [Jannaschia pohangensis]|uniref:Uncharacterized protein n=1 Tax=Jannaschia pohangensis TaxID=390807 RepID=A0A1I3MY81_9RHOB|nr:hypothetical protein SAMN04488095_1995 [Jannaschia pohangensis]
MNKIAPSFPGHPEHLMAELIELLIKVLDSHKDKDVATNLQVLVAEISGIRLIMDRHATAMEELLPRTRTVERLSDQQHELMALMEQMAVNLSWIRGQLDGDVDGST